MEIRWHILLAFMSASVVTTDGKVHILQHYVEILAAIPTFATAILTRSLLGTVVVGILSLMVLRFVL